MAEKTLKALAIKSKSNPPGRSEYKWDVIPEIDNFTKNIVIPELGIEKDGTTSRRGSHRLWYADRLCAGQFVQKCIG